MVLRGYSYLAMRRYGEAARIFESLTAIGNQDGIKGLAAVRAARPVTARRAAAEQAGVTPVAAYFTSVRLRMIRMKMRAPLPISASGKS